MVTGMGPAWVVAAEASGSGREALFGLILLVTIPLVVWSGRRGAQRAREMVEDEEG